MLNTNKLTSPKILIIDYYDGLIREIDIYTEDTLRKQSDGDKLLSTEEKTGKEEEKRSNKYGNQIETYGVEARIDPYIDQYSYDQESQSQSFEPGTTLKQYLDSIRMRMIEELNRLQDETLRNYELIKAQIQGRTESDNEVMSRLFENHFCFVLDIETICSILYDGSVEKMKPDLSSLYLITMDFYLSPEDIKLLKYFLYGWMDASEVHIHFNSKTLLVHLVYSYIRGYIRHNTSNKMIRIRKETLYLVNKINLDCRDIESLNLDNEEDQRVDLTNIKSLRRGKRPKISLSGLFNLEYLDLNELTIEASTFKNLTKLRHLYMMDCWMNSDESDVLFSNTPNLEYLRIIDPNALGQSTNANFALNFAILTELKWLRISHYHLNVDFFRSISQWLIALDLCFIRLDVEKIDDYFRDVKLPCLVKFELACCRIKCVKFEWFSGFTNLRELNLFENEIKTLDLTHFNLPHLAELDLCNNEIEELNDDAGFENFKSLKVLKLSNNRLKKVDVNLFSKLKNLRELYLSRNGLEELDLESFKEITLNHLDLSSNPVKLTDPSVFLKLTNIKKVDLTFCFTDAEVEEIREFLGKNQTDIQVIMRKKDIY